VNITVDQNGDSKVAIIESSELLIRDIQDALDLIASVSYNYECNKMIIFQTNLPEEFFELRTKLAGEILQKFVNYHVKLAIVGKFDIYNSKSLKDFIYECNNGKHVFFLADKEEALHALHNFR